MTTPTQLSLELLRKDGWMTEVVEHYNTFSGQRKDLFGLLDLIAVKGFVTLGVQTTSASNYNSRLNKLQSPLYAHTIAVLDIAGWVLEVHGWRKTNNRGHACTHGKSCHVCHWKLHQRTTVNPVNAK